MVDGNAYITVGDDYKDPVANPFRKPPKGTPAPTPFRAKVGVQYPTISNIFKIFLSDDPLEC